SMRRARASETAHSYLRLTPELRAGLLQIAPSVLEISGGKEDGATGFDFMDVDLIALPRCLDEVESFAYDPDYGEEPHLTLMGKKGKREVVVEIYFEPFEEDEP